MTLHEIDNESMTKKQAMNELRKAFSRVSKSEADRFEIRLSVSEVDDA